MRARFCRSDDGSYYREFDYSNGPIADPQYLDELQLCYADSDDSPRFQSTLKGFRGALQLHWQATRMLDHSPCGAYSLASCLAVPDYLGSNSCMWVIPTWLDRISELHLASVVGFWFPLQLERP
jgi:hypothetical protein